MFPDINRDFLEVGLEFRGKIDQYVFASHNAMIVANRLRHRRYRHIANEVNMHCPGILDEPLGLAPLRLKYDGNPFYRRFLNDYGDLVYSEFRLTTPGFESATGVFAYLECDIVRYLGQSTDSIRKYVDNGQGKIQPWKCYLDGQSADCRLNARITIMPARIRLLICSIDSDIEIVRVRTALIRKHNPAWNM